MAQLTGDGALPIAQLRSKANEPTPTLTRERKMPQDFPFYDLNSVRHVQKISSTLTARFSNRQSGRMVVTQQLDNLREEANKPAPDLDWVCEAIVSKKERYRLDRDWRTDTGRSLLHVVAAHSGSGKAVKRLLDEQFDVTTLDESGLSAFHIACIAGAQDAVAAMIKHHSTKKSTVDLTVYDTLTPLHAAALFDHVPVIKLLLDRGANAESVDQYGSSPLAYAILAGKFQAAKFLADKVFGLVNLCDTEGNSPLLLATYVAGRPEVTDLLNAGAKISQSNKIGLTPLWVAMQNNDEELASLLLDFKSADSANRVNVDLPLGPWGNTILMQAIAFLSERKAVLFTKMLLRKGASVNATNQSKKTALFVAALFDRRDVMKVLLENGADPNAKDINLNR